MDITTIIPTLCEASRRVQLLRAIQTIHDASVDRIRILVVVNGNRWDRDLLEHLQERNDIEVIRVDEGSQSNAQLVGRRAVRSTYFSFLDDDDEYLPGALDLRRALLQSNNLAAVAVTNGYLSKGGAEKLIYSRTALVSDNPLYELFQQNWLCDCNHLFRTSSVTASYFENAPSVLEWTWLGFRLSLDEKIVVASNATTCRINDTPGSLSKSTHFLKSRVELYDRMLAAGPNRAVGALIRRRKSNAWHEVSTAELLSGSRSKAIGAHLHSLTCHWSGLKYALFSRHLLRPKFRMADAGH